MKKLTLAVASAVLLATGGAVFAADLSGPAGMKDAPVSLSPVWSGLYFGGTVGMISANGDFRNDSTTYYEYYYQGDHYQTQSVDAIGGVEIGYNHQIGSMVLGIEADYSFTRAKGSGTFYSGEADYGVAVQQTLENLGTVRGRLGYALDRGLLFVTGGLAYGDVHSRAFDYDWVIYDHTKTRTGWTAGAGVEYALTPKWSVKAEGLYYDLGRDTGYGYDGSYGPYTDSATGVVARAGLNYRLSGCCDYAPLK